MNERHLTMGLYIRLERTPTVFQDRRLRGELVLLHLPARIYIILLLRVTRLAQWQSKALAAVHVMNDRYAN